MDIRDSYSEYQHLLIGIACAMPYTNAVITRSRTPGKRIREE